MATEYTWKIEGLETSPALNDEGVAVREGVVRSIAWRVTGVCGGKSADAYGQARIQYDPAEVFVDYAKLTERYVIAMAQAAIGERGLAAIYSGLELSLSPPPEVATIPWAAS